MIAQDEDDGNYGDDLSLREAIALANASGEADTITFGGVFTDDDTTNDTIILTSQLTLSSNITIDGSGGDPITVSGNDTTRVFYINPGAIVAMNDITIANGNAGYGGGIYNNSGSTGSLSLEGMIFSGNSANSYGGGIYNNNNSTIVTLSNSTFSSNSATTSGGSIYNYGTINTLSNSTFSGNSAGWGGGIDNIGTLTIDGSIFSNNQAFGGGAGIVSRGNLSTTNSTFSNNTVDDGEGIGTGGGLQLEGGTTNLTNVTISGNQALGDNDDGGGGIMVYGGNLTVHSSTITNNTSSSSTGAGGIAGNFYFGGSVTVENTIVAGNIGTNPDVNGAFTSNGSNLIGDSTGSTSFTHGVSGDIVGDSTNPIDPSLAALTDNGGPTLTHAPLAYSSAIDAGDNNQVSVSTDQRGTGFERLVSGTVDIGAYEVQNNAPTSAKTPPLHR